MTTPAWPSRRWSFARGHVWHGLLSVAHQQAVLDLLHAPRFADQAPAEIYASLLDKVIRAHEMMKQMLTAGLISPT